MMIWFLMNCIQLVGLLNNNNNAVVLDELYTAYQTTKQQQ